MKGLEPSTFCMASRAEDDDARRRPTTNAVNHAGLSQFRAARAAVKGYLDEVSRVAAAPVIEKYTGVLAAADVFTESTAFWVMESIRLDLGYGSQVHP
jgi:hypothetical protein